MYKSSNTILFMAVVAFILVVVAIGPVAPAYASLSPLAFGFPTWIQNSTSTALNQADVSSFNFGAASVNAPIMAESDISGQTVTTSNFLQNSIFSSYAYPAAGIGVSGISGFGF